MVHRLGSHAGPRAWLQCSAVIILKFLSSLEQEALHFHSALGPVNSEADLVYHSIPSTQSRADIQPLLSKTLCTPFCLGEGVGERRTSMELLYRKLNTILEVGKYCI